MSDTEDYFVIDRTGMRSDLFSEGQLVIYHNKGRDDCEIGRIKRITDDGAFVCYHAGETAAKTSFEDLMPIINDRHIVGVTLGGGVFDDEE